MDKKLVPFIIFAVLAVVGFLGMCVPAMQDANTENYLTSLETRFAAVQPAYSQAASTVETRSREFARHWSTTLHQQVTTLNTYLSETTGISVILRSARTAQSSDQGDPGQIARRAETMLGELETFTATVNGQNGQAGFYDNLQNQAHQAYAYVSSAEAYIDSTRMYLDVQTQDYWNRTHGVIFMRAYRELDRAEPVVYTANMTLVTYLGDDNVNYDLPLAYQQAAQVYGIVDSARAMADQDNAMSRAADTELTRAQSAITDAEYYISRSNYQWSYAQERLNIARSSYDQAYAAFWGNYLAEPNYSQAYDLAVRAQREAADARATAATPVPTQVPAPVIIIEVDDDDDYGGYSNSYDTDDESGSSWGWEDTSNDNSGDYVTDDESGSSWSWDDSSDTSSYDDSDDWGSDDDGWSDSDDWDSGDDGWGDDDGF